jgi:hypothetical protein
MEGSRPLFGGILAKRHYVSFVVFTLALASISREFSQDSSGMKAVSWGNNLLDKNAALSSQSPLCSELMWSLPARPWKTILGAFFGKAFWSGNRDYAERQDPSGHVILVPPALAPHSPWKLPLDNLVGSAWLCHP